MLHSDNQMQGPVVFMFMNLNHLLNSALWDYAMVLSSLGKPDAL